MSAVLPTLERYASLVAGHRQCLVDTGVLGGVIPSMFGGVGGDAVVGNRMVADVARESPSDAIIVFQHMAVGSRIVEWGTPQQRASLLPRLADGTWLAASAWSEVGAGASKRAIATTATPDGGGGWVLNGEKTFVTGAGVADVYLVLAQTGPRDLGRVYGADGQTLFLVPARVPGFTVGLDSDFDGMRGSATGSVRLDGCRIRARQVLGEVGGAAAVLASVRESGATLGAVSLGIAERAYELAQAHVAKGGRLADPVAARGLVDLRTRTEAIQASVERAGRRESADRGLSVLLSKLFASAEAEAVCAEAQRLIGAAGFLRSHPLNALMRDARAIALMGPTNDLCREIVSSSWTA